MSVELKLQGGGVKHSYLLYHGIATLATIVFRTSKKTHKNMYVINPFFCVKSQQKINNHAYTQHQIISNTKIKFTT